MGSDWRRIRDAHIARHPYCANVGQHTEPVPATIVDHIVPHRGDDRLRLDPQNLQSLCSSCHAVKTWREGPGYRGVAW